MTEVKHVGKTIVWVLVNTRWIVARETPSAEAVAMAGLPLLPIRRARVAVD
jgi:hypothetical protein